MIYIKYNQLISASNMHYDITKKVYKIQLILFRAFILIQDSEERKY